MRFSFLIFDLDGTLIDSAPDLGHAVNRVLAYYGRPPLELVQIKDMIGDGAAQLIARALAETGVPAQEHGRALRSFYEFYQADPTAHTTLFPEVAPTLEALTHQAFRLAVCTNKPAGTAIEILDRLNIARFFERVVGGDTFAFRKPDPRMLTVMIDAAGASHAETLMIGDSEVDAATALAARVAFALVGYGYRRGPVEDIDKCVLFDRFEQLTPFVSDALRP